MNRFIVNINKMRHFVYLICIVVIFQMIYQNKSQETTDDEKCQQFYNNAPTQPTDCTNLILSEENYLCCFIHYAVRDYNNDICQPIANTSKAIDNVKESFRNAKNVSILCNSQSLLCSFFPLFFVFAIILFI